MSGSSSKKSKEKGDQERDKVEESAGVKIGEEVADWSKFKTIEMSVFRGDDSKA